MYTTKNAKKKGGSIKMKPLNSKKVVALFTAMSLALLQTSSGNEIPESTPQKIRDYAAALSPAYQVSVTEEEPGSTYLLTATIVGVGATGSLLTLSVSFSVVGGNIEGAPNFQQAVYRTADGDNGVDCAILYPGLVQIFENQDPMLMISFVKVFRTYPRSQLVDYNGVQYTLDKLADGSITRTVVIPPAVQSLVKTLKREMASDFLLTFRDSEKLNYPVDAEDINYTVTINNTHNTEESMAIGKLKTIRFNVGNVGNISFSGTGSLAASGTLEGRSYGVSFYGEKPNESLTDIVVKGKTFFEGIRSVAASSTDVRAFLDIIMGQLDVIDEETGDIYFNRADGKRFRIYEQSGGGVAEEVIP